MVCQTSNSPIDLNFRSNRCTDNCEYNFDYKVSDCVSTNSGTHLKFTYSAPQSSVVFNGVSYSVQDVRVYAPSLHKFNNKRVDAELIITHSAPETSKLIVCIPIVAKNSQLDSRKMLDELIMNSPGDRNATQAINASNYNLNRVVPQGSYFSYFAKLPYPECNEDSNILVFDSDYAANMSLNTKTYLYKVTTDLDNPIKKIPRTNIYYNKNGPNQGAQESGSSSGGDESDDIYIDCKPLGGENDEPVYVNNDKSVSDMKRMNIFDKENIDKFLSSPYFIVLMVLLVLGLIVIVGQLIKRYGMPNLSSMPSLTRRTASSS